MSEPKKPLPVKGFMSIISSNGGLIKEIIKLLEGDGKSLDMVSEAFPFLHTNYYEKEMGKSLVRKFVSIKELIMPDYLLEWKYYAYSLEKDYADGSGKRRINLDPGYLAPEKLILSTFKNFSHRVYISRGVYADMTLIFRDGRFQPLEWTFPDYREDGILRFFRVMRNRYMYQLRSSKR